MYTTGDSVVSPLRAGYHIVINLKTGLVETIGADGLMRYWKPDEEEVLFPMPDGLAEREVNDQAHWWLRVMRIICNTRNLEIMDPEMPIDGKLILTLRPVSGLAGTRDRLMTKTGYIARDGSMLIIAGDNGQPKIWTYRMEMGNLRTADDRRYTVDFDLLAQMIAAAHGLELRGTAAEFTAPDRSSGLRCSDHPTLCSGVEERWNVNKVEAAAA